MSLLYIFINFKVDILTFVWHDGLRAGKLLYTEILTSGAPMAAAEVWHFTLGVTLKRTTLRSVPWQLGRHLGLSCYFSSEDGA